MCREYEHFDILEVAGKCGIKLYSNRGSEVEFKARCPFCGDSSYHLGINRQKERFNCFRCGERGNSVSLYAKVYGVSNKEAFKRLKENGDFQPKYIFVPKTQTETPMRSLADRHDVYYDFLNLLRLNRFHREGLEKRGLCVKDMFQFIGYAIAKGLAQAGAKIIFNDINEELVNKGLDSYKADGIDAKGYVCDVTDENAVNEMVAKIEKEVGVIDILVNNAGIIKRIPMCEMSADDFRKVIDVDLNAPFICAKAVIPSMIKKGHGKIINICSMMSELGRETVSAYAAAKGGLKMLTRNICSEYGEYNIQCNGIGPGYIATPQTAPLREVQENGERHPFDKFIISKTPAARWGDPEELAGPAVFLASDASNFVNGHILYVDGGILAYIGKQP